MTIGDGEPEAAFIEHVAQSGRLVTVAARRCPNLPPKRYRLTVGYPDATITGTVTVTG